MALPLPSTSLQPTVRSLVIDGKRFEITLIEEDDHSWRWCITAPGTLALSGAAASEMQALHHAGRAGRTLARLEAGVNPPRA